MTPKQDQDKDAPIDQTFDQLSGHFQKKIYDSPKGQIRLDLLQRDLQPIREQSSLAILDAGGGLGNMSRWLAEAGHTITLIDAAEAMLVEAKKLNQQEGLADLIRLEHSTISDFVHTQQPQARYDLILCHAVLEWLEQPELAIEQLSGLLADGGTLSLMFYNQHSLVLRNALRGNLRKVKRADWSGDGKGLTPYQALLPETVYQWLENNGLNIELTSGIRCFFDYLPKHVKENYDMTDLLDLERDHYRTEPYIHMARYIHVSAKKPTA